MTAGSPDANAAPKLLGVTGALYVVALFVFSARIHTVFRERQLGWDDLAISFALVRPLCLLSTHLNLLMGYI
jgi:hypothetical protein